ncbi:bone morphogenetic protein 7 isoform X1 [Lingula anatina]|uniref:Bone morphogenetic protein 7 isoform X1 n=1 Tax=Lingula anatina TaxID=7574 RepID=A0A1S3HNH4_LINAN|nr:bone morphogenetic protein 7 isoform X1 [Lingula anatina]|eukprot:XP_013387608.2 bone morphogenetic protein 7 isoform X1 [Lingula anatina]
MVNLLHKPQWQAVVIVVILTRVALTHALPTPGHHSHKRLKRERLHAIQKGILNKLGLQKVPDASRFNITSEEREKMIRLYNKSLQLSHDRTHVLYEREEYFAKTFHSFSSTDPPAASEIDPRLWNDNKKTRLYFDVRIPQPKDGSQRQLHLHSATLNLFKTRTFPQRLKDKTNVGKSITLSVYHYTRRLKSGKIISRRLIDSKPVSLYDPGWISFDIKDSVQVWMDNPRKNFGIEVTSEGQDLSELVEFSMNRNSSQDSTNDTYSVENDLSPSLHIYTQLRPLPGRPKRTLERKDCAGEGNERCCRQPLRVYFKDIGWDSWVVAPEYYDAYYCDGSCPHKYKSAYTFSTIKALIQLFNPAAAPAPCCTANKLSPLILLHFDEDGNLVQREYDDMIVEECKCA